MIWYPHTATGRWSRASHKDTAATHHLEGAKSPVVQQSVDMMHILAAVQAAGGEGVTAAESDLLWQTAMRLRLALFPEVGEVSGPGGISSTTGLSV